MDGETPALARVPAFTLAVLGAAMAASAECADVYKWVDRNGVTHFSEAPPAEEFGSLEIIDMERLPPASSGIRSDYRAMLDVAARIEQSRLERERLRLEQQRMAQEMALAHERQEQPVSERVYVGPGFYYPRYYRPAPRHRPRHYPGPFLESMPRVRPHPPGAGARPPVYSRHDPGR